MVVEKIRLEEKGQYCQLTARVRGEAGSGEENELWFRFPNHVRPHLAEEGDAFLATLLLPAMVREQRLHIEGRVSPRLLRSASQIQDIYAAWFKIAHRVAIQADGRPEPVAPPGRGTGSFFSGGVDSFYTLLKQVDAITHLLLIEGFDFKMVQSEEACREAKERMAGVATRLGKELLVVATNARKLSEPLVGWNDYHGAVLAGVGLSLQNLFQTIYVAASAPYWRLRPWGSHPFLDPLWSTEQTQIVHHGAELSRVEKTVDCICRSELALQNLRVCWAPGAEYNCGRCEKCLRTMISLYIGGALGRCSVLPRTLPLQEVKRQRYTSDFQIAIALEIIALLEQKTDPAPFDRHLKQAIETAIQRSRKRMAQSQRRQLRFTPRRLWDVIRRRFRSAPQAEPMAEALANESKSRPMREKAGRRMEADEWRRGKRGRRMGADE